MTDKGLSFGRLFLHDECFPLSEISVNLVNFFREGQWIPKDIVLGNVVSASEAWPEVDDPISPERILDFNVAIYKDLPEKDREAFRVLLQRYSACFATSNTDFGCANLVRRRI